MANLKLRLSVNNDSYNILVGYKMSMSDNYTYRVYNPESIEYGFLTIDVDANPMDTPMNHYCTGGGTVFRCYCMSLCEEPYINMTLSELKSAGIFTDYQLESGDFSESEYEEKIITSEYTIPSLEYGTNLKLVKLKSAPLYKVLFGLNSSLSYEEGQEYDIDIKISFNDVQTDYYTTIKCVYKRGLLYSKDIFYRKQWYKDEQKTIPWEKAPYISNIDDHKGNTDSVYIKYEGNYELIATHFMYKFPVKEIGENIRYLRGATPIYIPNIDRSPNYQGIIAPVKDDATSCVLDGYEYVFEVSDSPVGSNYINVCDNSYELNVDVYADSDKQVLNILEEEILYSIVWNMSSGKIEMLFKSITNGLNETRSYLSPNQPTYTGNSFNYYIGMLIHIFNLTHYLLIDVNRK